MPILHALNQTYRSIDSDNTFELESLAAVVKQWLIAYPQHAFLHPCVINTQAALVCQANLQNNNPRAYRALAAVVKQHGITLKQDQREKTDAKRDCRRSPTMAVLSLCLGLLSTPSLGRPQVSETQVLQNFSSNPAAYTRKLSAQIGYRQGKKLIKIRRAAPPTTQTVLQAYHQYNPHLPVRKTQYNRIAAFLNQHYLRQPGDPVNITHDFDEIAAYFAKFPDVIRLLQEIQGPKLQLIYKKNHWQAKVSVTATRVEKVEVSFDTRLGAQFMQHQHCQGNPACHATPADLLLHELLHAKLMLVHSQDFIDQGGLQPTLYLFEHEREVIALENALYDHMTQQDGMSRPIRKRHSGTLLQVRCALCLPGETQTLF